ncbi:MAG TPA: sialidase, partial [Candidatus Kryptobacter bacterium]|nr:sialidase [Candidatus Kryptobacter bacterium]
PDRWKVLNYTVEVNKLLGYGDRVALTSREGHLPTVESNKAIYRFFKYFLMCKDTLSKKEQ